MPALTAAQISQQLGQYIEPDGDFLAALNQVLPRVYSMGMWRDTVYEIQLDAGNGYISLPEDTEAVLSATVDDLPRPVRNMWHDIRQIGRQDQIPGFYGLIDLGYHPVTKDLTTVFEVTDPEDISPGIDQVFLYNLTTGSSVAAEDLEGVTITITGTQTSGGQQISASISGVTVEFSQAINTITSITFDNLPFAVSFRVDGDTRMEIATAPAGSGTTQFRRFKVTGAQTDSVVTLLVKRKAPFLTSGDEIIHLANINAIKHALLGRIAEDNADVQRANYHWGVCRQMLEDELDASRGSARPMIQMSGFGEGASHPYNIY
jgi:hypothetical protein